MVQVITRMDEELAAALKARAKEVGVSVNEYVTRLVRVAVGGPATATRAWKAKGVAEGWLADRPRPAGRTSSREDLAEWRDRPATAVAGYRNPIVEERDEHR